MKAEYFSLIWLKFAVTFLGYFFAVVVQIAPPTELATLPENTSPQDIASIKIGGFAFIVAISLLVLLIPTGVEQRDKLVDGAARLLGVLSALGAAWHTLDAATQGNPGLYLVGIGTLTGFAILILLVGGGIWAVILLALRVIAATLDAAFLCLLTVPKYAIRFLARKPNRKQDCYVHGAVDATGGGCYCARTPILVGTARGPMNWKQDWILVLRGVAVVIGALFLGLNFLVKDADLATIDPKSSYNITDVRAAGFAIISAGFVFFAQLPKRRKEVRNRWDALIDGLVPFLGVFAAGSAGWYVLDNAMDGKPGVYFIVMGTFVGVVAFAFAFWSAILLLYSRIFPGSSGQRG